MKAFCLAVAALLAMTPAAYANETQQLPRVVVSYSDLDLATPNGQAELRERVGYAINRVCRINSGRDTWRAMQCRTETRARVLAESTGAVRVALTGENGGAVQIAQR
jgi:UrcA family protein